SYASINVGGTRLRSTQLLYAPDVWKALFSAPHPPLSIWDTGTSSALKAVPFVLSDWLHRFMVYPTRQIKQSVVKVRGLGAIGSGQIIQIDEVPGLHFYALDWPQSVRLRKTLFDGGVAALLSFAAQDKVANPPSHYF